MAHQLTALTLNVPTTIHVFPLRPFGTTQHYAAGYVKIKAILPAGSTDNKVTCKLINVPDGEADPLPVNIPPFNLPLAGAINDTFELSTKVDENNEIEIGQLFAQGFRRDVHGHPVGTHLVVLVQDAQSAFLQITVD